MNEWVRKNILITVRTYPTPSRKDVEVSCTGGITEDKEWIRVFPVPYRFLRNDTRFRKYQWISASVRPATADRRPESYNIDVDSIKILTDPIPTSNKWVKRKDMLSDLIVPSFCAMEETRAKEKFPTLGVFRPKVIEQLEIKPTKAEWSPEQIDKLRQHRLFQQEPDHELEKLPYEFRYHFRCKAGLCPGHNLMCTDWEAGQAFRKFRDRYGGAWEEKFRQRFETEMIEKNDTHFYVGTVHRFPDTWLIVGLFYPKR